MRGGVKEGGREEGGEEGVREVLCSVCVHCVVWCGMCGVRVV